MNCPICGIQLDDDAKECFVCGYKLENYASKSSPIEGGNTIVCPMCGAAVDQSKSVCPVCGTKLKPNIKKNVGDSITDNKSQQEIKKPSSKPVANKRSDVSGKNKPDNIQAPERKKTKQAAEKPKQKRTGLIIAIVCIIAACIVVILFLTGVIGSSGRGTDNINSNSGTGLVSGDESSAFTEEENVAPNSSYIGYWNIGGNANDELTISNVTDNTVEFSLFSRGIYDLEDAVAHIDENNFASFACVDGKLMMTGNLIFYDDYIVVDIDRADMDYIDTGTMVFDERHLSSWHGDDNENVNSQSTTSQNTANSNEAEPYYESGNISTYYDSYYILPDSSTRLLDYNDIRYLTKDELRLARNEIYARHGRKFDDPTLQAYFNSQPWYVGTIEPEDFTQSMLSSIERSNIAFIESYE